MDWIDEANRSFKKRKFDLANAALLAYPNPEVHLATCTDISDVVIGSVLQQFENRSWNRIAFFSKRLNKTQRTYSTDDRELLDIYLSTKQFKHLVEGRDFSIISSEKLKSISTSTVITSIYLSVLDQNRAYKRSTQCCCRYTVKNERNRCNWLRHNSRCSCKWWRINDQTQQRRFNEVTKEVTLSSQNNFDCQHFYKFIV